MSTGCGHREGPHCLSDIGSLQGIFVECPSMGVNPCRIKRLYSMGARSVCLGTPYETFKRSLSEETRWPPLTVPESSGLVDGTRYWALHEKGEIKFFFWGGSVW